MRIQSSTWTGAAFSVMAAALLLQSAGCADSQVGPEVSALSVSVIVSGVDTHRGFLVSLDGHAPRPVPEAGFIFRSIASGRHTLTLSGFRENCSLDGANPVVVDVPRADMA